MTHTLLPHRMVGTQPYSLHTL